MNDIPDSNGSAATPLQGVPVLQRADAQAFIAKMDLDLAEIATPPENVTAFPEPELERTAKIKQCGDRRAIELLFETKLDGERVNLLLARIYVAAENAEREVQHLGDKTVRDILKKFKQGPAGANGATVDPKIYTQHQKEDGGQ